MSSNISEAKEDQTKYCCDSMRLSIKDQNGIHRARYLEGMDFHKEIYYCYTKWVNTPARLLIFDHCPFCGKRLE